MQVILFAEMPAVVGPKDDDGVVRRRAGRERVEQAADKRVAVGNVCEIRLQQLAKLAFLRYELEVTTPIRRHALATGGNIIEVIGFHHRQRDAIQRIHLKILSRRVKRQVRPINARSQKERL